MKLTVKYECLAARILGKVVITSPNGESITVPALWDTGATGSMITEGSARKLKLKKTGKHRYRHAGGSDTAPVYEAAIEIQGDSEQDNLNIGMVNIPAMFDAPNFGMIIGMDVIARGDFSIKNKNGKSVFTFTC